MLPSSGAFDQRGLVDRAGVVVQPAHHAKVHREGAIRHAELADGRDDAAQLVQPFSCGLVGDLFERAQGLIRRPARSDQLEKLACGRNPPALEIGTDLRRVFLLGLVQDTQHRGGLVVRHPERLQQAAQHLAVVDADAELADRHFLEHAVDHARDFRFGEVGELLATDDVDVALVELAPPPLFCLRRLAAPDALDLVAAERKRELALAHRDVARERHRQVEAQRALGGGLVVVGLGEARERVDFLLHAALRGQHLAALGRRRLDRQEAVELEVATDDVDQPVEVQLVLRQVLLVEAPQQAWLYFLHFKPP